MKPFPPWRLRLQLLQRIHRHYQTSTAIVRIGGLEFPFTRIADPDHVLDQVAAEEDRREKATGQRHADPLHLPYWAELWDSASGLAQLMIREGIPQNLNVLDLGCGMGLSGTAAAMLGARVLFADLESPALLFARLNSVERCDRVRARQLNWQQDRLHETFDLILGADILYEKKQWEFLDPFFRAHLHERGNVLLGEPGRPSGEMFIPWIKQRGWSLEELSEKVPTRAQPIRVIRLRYAKSFNPLQNFSIHR